MEDELSQEINSSLIRLLQDPTAKEFISYQHHEHINGCLFGDEGESGHQDPNSGNSIHRLSHRIEYSSHAGIINQKSGHGSTLNHGTKLYTYMIFNLALSAPLSVILIILSSNLGKIHERFYLDLMEFETVWRHDISSIILDVCVFMCYFFWMDYCMNGLILFRYISILMQICTEKLTGYNGGETLFHLEEAQTLFSTRFSWKMWSSSAFHRTSMMDVYKLHSIIWMTPVIVFFVLRNHISPSYIPNGLQTGLAVFLVALLSLSNLRGLYLQARLVTGRLEKFLTRPTASRGAIEKLILYLISKRRRIPSNASVHRSKNQYLLGLSSDDRIYNLEDNDILHFVFVQTFIFVVYALLGGGCLSLALRLDQYAFLEVDPWLLFAPIFVTITLVMVYNLVTHIKLSYEYVYQNGLFYFKSGIIMMLFFIFLLIQSSCFGYITIAYALKIQEVWSVDWMSIFLPLFLFEVLFSLVGLSVLFASTLRVLCWMWGQARFVSKRSNSEEIEVNLELL